MLLSAKNLVAERDEIELFRPLDLSLCAGEIVHLIGANGSGKSTLIRGLLGLNQALCGDIDWHCESIAYIGHKPGLNGALSVAQSLQQLMYLDGMDYQMAQVMWALEQVNLAPWADQLAGKLSAGQTRKVALSRLYCQDAPTVWLLDEPYTALDQASTQALSQRIEAHAQEGGSVLLTSHQGLAGLAHRQVALQP